MEDLKYILADAINEDIEQVTLSNTRRADGGNVGSKVKLRPILLKNELCCQETRYKGTQVFHQNYSFEQATRMILKYLETDFRQCQIETGKEHIVILISKKGKITVNRKKRADREDIKKNRTLEHNRVKKYILEEGKPVDFLVGLGVQTPDGKVVKAKYDKFRQINRYLEFIEDILLELPSDRTLNILDFGCGKSYLTFAMYYYLCVLKGYSAKITGLDLKEDVIKNCNKLAQEYGYTGLKFERGNISGYEGAQKVDMVVTLHACDTATDFALYKAIQWDATVIMAVPCCQHEVNRQISCSQLAPIFKYGVIKERISALITDAVRAELLQEMGYETQILEFIDMEHTPKNLLIRAVKKQKIKHRSGKKIEETCDFLNIDPTLRELLNRK